VKKKTKLFLLVLGLIILILTVLFLFTNIYSVFLGPLDIGTGINPDYGDVILVLGGGLRKGPEIGYSTEERLLQAIELFKQKNRMLIISDGSLYNRSPAIKKMTDFLVERGVGESFIILEGKSQTTYESLIYVRKILNELNSKEVIVCTSPYHQKRAHLILKYLKFNNFKIARMNHSEIDQAATIKQRLRNSWLILREYLAILKFKISKK